MLKIGSENTLPHCTAHLGNLPKTAAVEFITGAHLAIVIHLIYINKFLFALALKKVTQQERRHLCELIKKLRFTVEKLGGYREAVITRGGINVKEINPATMESKLVSGLFFAGEVIDVDAYTGGFNLQVAWSTGYLAGESAAVG